VALIVRFYAAGKDGGGRAGRAADSACQQPLPRRETGTARRSVAAAALCAPRIEAIT